MTKKEFLKQLRLSLKNEADKEEIINYYDELIDEATLNGEIESQFIDRLGPIDDIIKQMDKTPYKKRENKSVEVVKKTTSKVSRLLLETLIMSGYALLMVVSFSFIVGGAFQTVKSVSHMGNASTNEVMIYYIGEMIFTIGLCLMGIGLMWYANAAFRKSIRKIKTIANEEEK